MNRPSDTRTYCRTDSAVFRKTAEAFGGLSNMAPGYPIRVNGVRLLTTEALYQACRFPHRPEVQRLIIGQLSPMTAKMKSKPYRSDSRPDWDRVRVKVMRWCLQLKLAQHWVKFSHLLLLTGDKPIVEDSRKDDFWGAKATDSNTLVGMNVLGRLLMGLREDVKQGKELRLVEPPMIPDFLLFGAPITVVDFRVDRIEPPVVLQKSAAQPLTVYESSLPLFEYVAATSPSEYSPHNELRRSSERKQSMIEVLKPYEEYKESGSRWLGAVPAGWEVRNLRTLITRRNERNRPDLPLLSVAREKGVFVRSLTDASENHNVIPEDLRNYKVARSGNLVINKMKAWQGSMGIAPCNGIVSPAYYVFDFHITNRAFGQALFRSKPYVSHFGQASDGVRIGQWDLSIDRMRQIPVLLPSGAEQAAIVRFLDHANRKIDRFIRAKRKLIALLNEQTQAIIHRAVTRGLNPDAKLKPSGISWLGDIPEHWEVRRVKQVTSILRGKFSHRPRNDSSLYDGPYPFIQTGSVARAKKFITHYTQTLNDKGLSVSKLFPKGTLCMTIAANIGDVAILDFEACFPDSIVGFVPNSQLDRDFLYLVFLCMKAELLRDAPVNTQGNLNIERVGTKCIPFPEIHEQQSIVKNVEMETGAFEDAIARTEREIALMQEYRTRLTADVVTGKLDVREAAAKLPESEENAEPDADALDEELFEEAEAEETDE